MMWLLVGLAIADVPPPPGYEEQCTVEKMQVDGLVCKECSASFQGREECEALEKEEYVAKCKTNGASVWKEVLCKTGAEPAAAAPEAKTPEPKGEELVEPPKKEVEREEKGCATAPGGAFGLSLLALAMVRRRSV